MGIADEVGCITSKSCTAYGVFSQIIEWVINTSVMYCATE